MDILITGHKGFIGSNLYKALEPYHNVFGLEKEYSVDSLIKKDYDIVIHCGALARTAECNLIFDAHNLNVKTTLDLLKDLFFKKFIYISSCAIYGSSNAVITENTYTNPPSVYAAQKLYSEHIVNYYGLLNDVSTISLRLFNVYGPGQSKLGQYPNVIASLCRSILNNNYAEVTGDGSQIRDFVHVSDVVEAIKLCVNHYFASGNYIYNVCTNVGTSVHDVAKYLTDSTNNSSQIKFIEPRQFDMYKQIGSFDKIKNELGWQPTINIIDGLADLVNKELLIKY